MTEDDVVRLEREGWDALTQGAAAALEHYDRVLAPDPVMLLPGGLVLEDREDALRSMQGAPWDDYELEDVAVRDLGTGARLVTYGARARRGDLRYSALMSSVYVRRDGWRLAFHQQTPR